MVSTVVHTVVSVSTVVPTVVSTVVHTLKRPLSGRPRYGHVPLPGGLNSSYYDNKMAILQSQLLWYTINHTQKRDHECAHFVVVCVRYVHVVCVYIIIATWFVVCNSCFL